MPNELWEVVRPHDLKVGDVILSADMKRPVAWRDVDAECVASQPDQYRLMRLRRYDGPSPEVLMRALVNLVVAYDGPSPEVLMRALVNLVVAYGGVASLYDFEDEVKEVDELIAEAEAEIAAETKGGAK